METKEAEPKRFTRRQILKAAGAVFGLLVLDALTSSCGGTTEKELDFLIPSPSPEDPKNYVPGIAKSKIETPTPSPTPELSPVFQRLKESLQAEIQNFDGDAAIVITDLEDNETISINGDAQHRTGCAINILSYLVVLEDLQNGKYELTPDLEWLIIQGVPKSQPKYVNQLVQATIGSTEEAVRRANELLQRLGTKNSVMDHLPLYGGLESPPNYFSANDANLILTKLYRGEILNQEWTSFAINTLTNTDYTVDFIIPRFLPPELKIPHKIGYYANDTTGLVYNDIGFVIADQTQAFSIAYFSQYGKWTTSDLKETEGAILGRQLTEITFAHFKEKRGL